MNFNIKSMRTYIALTLCSSFFVAFAKEHFEIQVLDTGLITNETKICLYNDTQEIGFISYMKVPFVSRYVIHTFFVYPDMRNKGYGTELLSYTCDTLKDIGASLIYIQPGPFELINGRFQNVQFPEPKIKQLVKLYERCDFTRVDGITRTFAYILYTCMQLDENPEYLLYKSLSD